MGHILEGRFEWLTSVRSRWSKRRLYNEKDSLWEEDRRKIKREERKRITIASTLINSEFNNNSSPRITISSSFISISLLVYSRDPY